mgnify:CR=1 FL=1
MRRLSRLRAHLTLSLAGLALVAGLVLVAPAAAQNYLWSTVNGIPTAPLARLLTPSIGTTSTDGVVLINTSAAASAAQQQSPRLRLHGAGWKTTATAASQNVDMVLEVVPVEGAAAPSGRWSVSSAINDGSYTEVFFVTTGGSVEADGYMLAGGGNVIGWSSRNQFSSPANGLVNASENAQAIGVQVNIGTAAPTVDTCGTGTITANSNNSVGDVTATGATACTVTFGAPAWTNQPFCVVQDVTSEEPSRISAISTTAFTVTGLVSGDRFLYLCLGGV